MRDKGTPRLARWLVRLLPVDVREAHGRELQQALSDTHRDRARGTVSGGAFWLAAAWDILRTAPRHHLEALFHDIRYTWRSLRRAPAFAAAALATIALGTGAAISVFTFVNAVLLRPLPFADPGRIALIWAMTPDRSRTWLSVPELEDISTRSRSLQRQSGWSHCRPGR